MKKCYKSLAIIFILISYATAQNTAPSGLQLEDRRTEAERVEFLMNTAKAYLIAKETDETINALKRLLAIDPKNDEANYILSFAYIDGKRYLEAEKLLLELSVIYPDDFKIWNNLAWLYATAEDPNVRDGKKAVKYAHEAMVIAPKDHHVWSTLAEAYYVSGDYEKAYRAITHMAYLAQYATSITKEGVDQYNEQLKKCKRALDAHNAMSKEQK